MSLSGTPAEAGVRGEQIVHFIGEDFVSVEPPPKQGCEDQLDENDQFNRTSQWNPRRSRGARLSFFSLPKFSRVSQWNPRRSRGARPRALIVTSRFYESQWNPRRSRGARAMPPDLAVSWSGLSGTPAEAGVRGAKHALNLLMAHVSVEPPPKQGCENVCSSYQSLIWQRLSGTPAEAGVRGERRRMHSFY